MWRLRTPLGKIGIFLVLVSAALFYFLGSSSESPTTPPAIPAPKSPVTAAPKPTLPTAANEKDRQILTLFDSPLDGEGLAFERQLRERYRNAYVGIYLLKTCNIDVNEYHTKLAANLSREWAKHGSPTPPTQDIRSMLQAIMEDASSSYSLIYSATPCNERNLSAFTDFFEKLPK